ncbi:ABATE domain-containing protein [Actinoallomurus purpureus]|uniref:CGNR zinc finger domain-containing protein n=1 Tax=Actinoallomurus purpureus TaxID=478114 RepID=UPI002092BAC8|nr:ABATE domain-containing protein [Actinoallomurus purpureus]MCO6005449.1 ABATE domain-containing protein [Actinoallomurus purpureus]
MPQDKFDFRFRGGRLCLDFAATLGGRYREPVERLAVPADLGRWFRLALSLPADLPAQPRGLDDARALREAVHRLVHPATRAKPARSDVELLNSWAVHPDFAPELSPDARSVTLRSARTVEAGLATVARDAIDLLTGPWLERVRECAFSDCSLMFVDTSRPGQRQWCDMKACGNRHKVRQYRKAHAR